MNLFVEGIVIRELIEQDIIPDMDRYMFDQLKSNIFESNPSIADGIFTWQLEKIDWNTEAIVENSDIHHLIDKCMMQQIRIYRLYCNFNQ